MMTEDNRPTMADLMDLVRDIEAGRKCAVCHSTDDLDLWLFTTGFDYRCKAHPPDSAPVDGSR
jgi:hypothetical protein